MTPLEVALAGAVAGAGGALALTPLVRATRWRPAPVAAGPRRNPLAPGVILSEAPIAPPDLLQMTAVFVQKVATGLFGTSLPVSRQRLLGLAWHVTYGAFWAIGYSIVQTSIAVPAFLVGPVYGLVVWAVGPAWLVPRMRLMLPLDRVARRVTALVVAWHVFYGVVVAAVFSLLTA